MGRENYRLHCSRDSRMCSLLEQITQPKKFPATDRQVELSRYVVPPLLGVRILYASKTREADISVADYVAVLLAGMFVPFFLATTYSIEHLHASKSISYYIVSVLNAAQFFGRVLPGWASDFKHPYFGPEAWQFLGELSLGIMGFWWAQVYNLGGYIPWAVIYGFCSGLGITLPALVLPYICPNLAVYGTRIGMLYACAGIGFLISTPVASAANAATGGFLGAQVWTGATCVTAALCFLVTALEARKRRLLYEMGKRDRAERKIRGLLRNDKENS